MNKRKAFICKAWLDFLGLNGCPFFLRKKLAVYEPAFRGQASDNIPNPFLGGVFSYIKILVNLIRITAFCLPLMRVRVSRGHLRKAEAPTEAAAETVARRMP